MNRIDTPSPYRVKVALALAETLGEPVAHTRFQKLLFLVSLKQDDPSYHFFPYHYGCYSLVAAADQSALAHRGFLDPNWHGWKLERELNVTNEIKEADVQAIQDTVSEFGALTTNQLLEFIYNRYPYFAQNSRVRDQFVSPNTTFEVHLPREETDILYTVGYEGDSIEEFLNKLIFARIRLLVDVRRNPISRKFGFSKTRLRTFLGNLGIEYLHLGKLGIPSSIRSSYLQLDDRRGLFEWYKASVLGADNEDMQGLFSQLSDKKGIALLCFERNSSDCHRSVLADFVSKTMGTLVVSDIGRPDLKTN